MVEGVVGDVVIGRGGAVMLIVEGGVKRNIEGEKGGVGRWVIDGVVVGVVEGDPTYVG